MIVKLVKNLVKLGFYSVGLAVVLGVWDYTRQAKSTDYQYSFEEYKLSVLDRYGEEAVYAMSVLDAAENGLNSGIRWVEQTGLLEKAGVSIPQGVIASDLDVIPNETQVDPDFDGALRQLAVVNDVLAPETSLFPQARSTP